MRSPVSLPCALILFLANVLLCRCRRCPYVDTKGQLLQDLPKTLIKYTYNIRRCFKSACGIRKCKLKHCVAFLLNESDCYRFDDSFLATNMVKNGQVKSATNMQLATQIVKEDVMLPHPAGLWMFDAKSKGRNLGTKGKLLNCYDRETETYGMSQSFQFTAIGPKGSESNWRYVVAPETIDACSIYLWDKESLLLDVEKPLTIVFWIKTRPQEAHMPILEGRPLYTFDLWLYPSKYRDQLTFTPKERSPDKQNYVTVRNATDISNWRHMAVVYRKPGDVTFYLNGDIWPHSNPQKIIPGAKQPHYFNVFNYGGYRVPYSGNMACLAYFESHALTQPQIRLMKERCP